MTSVSEDITKQCSATTDFGHESPCRIMGILNVTPDSFSDGGDYLATDGAIARGLAMAAQGADIVDIGGESTRPGAGRISVEEELSRVLPVVDALADAGLVVSIDTSRATVAKAALAAGAMIVNDVSSGADPLMGRVVARAGVPFVAVHSRGPSLDMQTRAVYLDVVGEVRAELAERIRELSCAGVDPTQIIVDPGLGFAKTAAHNWKLLANLDKLAAPRFPLLVGASRKSFLAAAEHPDRVKERDTATAAVSALAAAAGVRYLRVHDVAGTVEAIRVARAWISAGTVDSR